LALSLNVGTTTLSSGAALGAETAGRAGAIVVMTLSMAARRLRGDHSKCNAPRPRFRAGFATLASLAATANCRHHAPPRRPKANPTAIVQCP
jgi:hypothetical protein